MTTCAVCRIDNGQVINVIVADPSDVCSEDTVLIEIPVGTFCDIGWMWDGRAFFEATHVSIENEHGSFSDSDVAADGN